jgi:glycosyltransferase involved in cell wall biosynthesis
MPWLSVITVTWNAGKALQKTYESLRNQDNKNFEWIIIDGGSSDETLSLITSFGDFVSKWVSEKDGGIYDAMNKGLSLATGEYVWFLNAGDCAADAEVITRLYKANGAEVLYGDAKMITPEGKDLGLRRGGVPSTLQLSDLRTGLKVSHQATIVKRNIAPEYNLKYKITGDLDWLIRILKTGASTKCVKGIICVFETGGVSGTRYREAMIERYNCLAFHFGVFPTLFAHIWIIIKAPFVRLFYRY